MCSIKSGSHVPAGDDQVPATALDRLQLHPARAANCIHSTAANFLSLPIELNHGTLSFADTPKLPIT